jgi:hypothetical protein
MTKRPDGIEWTEFEWKVVDASLADGPSNCWVNLPEAVRYIAETLDVLPGEAHHLLRSEAMPPAVPWVGLALAKSLNHADGRMVPIGTVIDASWLTDPEIEFSSGFIMSPRRGPIFLVHVEGNHLEAWLNKKRRAPVIPAEPPQAQPGPKPPPQRDAEIGRRLTAGERPSNRKTWCDEIRAACGTSEWNRGYSDDRISRVTNDMLRSLVG